MAGRPRKPTVLKLLEGNPGGRPLPDAEPVVATPVDKAAPSELTPSQKEHWDYVMEHSPDGLIRSLDRDYLLTWVEAVDAIRVCEAHIRAEGIIIKIATDVREVRRPDGTVVITRVGDRWCYNPWADARDKAFQRMVKAASELGFSPTSRTRISLTAGGTAKEANRFSRNASAAKARA